MKRFLKRTASTLMCVALALGVYEFGPEVYVRFFGDQAATWISERFSETLSEKNELVVYEIETTGQETVSQDAWLLGTVQKVEMPYTFNMCFMIDLDRATVSVVDDVIEVRIPTPNPGYAKLTVDEDNVKKSDWLYRLTPERYAQIKQEVENRLFLEYSQNEQFRENAWNIAVSNLESLLRGVADQSVLGKVYTIRIMEDSSL